MTTANLLRRDPAGRRRSGTGDRRKKVGWQVRESVARAVKEAVDGGAAQSQNAFVEEALLQHLKELRRLQIYEAYERAAADRGFMEEMRATDEAFAPALRDGVETGV